MEDSIEGEDAAFWLPSHFLNDDDLFKDDIGKLPTQKCYDLFSNTGFGPAQFDSPVSSTNNDENNNEDDSSLLSHLSRHMARSSLHDSYNNNKNTTPKRPCVFSTSPQSTLTGFSRSVFSSNGSPDGPSRVPSPPLTQELKNDAAWDLLYEAAGQVGRLKMNAITAQMANNRALLGAPRHSCGFIPSSDHNLYSQKYEELKWVQNLNNLGSRQKERENNWSCNHQQRRSCGGGEGALDLPQTAWPPLTGHQPHHLHHHRQSCCGSDMSNRELYQGGGKRQSNGTGVFLPLHHRPQSQYSEFRPKPTGMHQTRGPQTVSMEFEESNLRFDRTRFPADLAVIMARRNAIMRQQQRRKYAAASMMGQGHEIRLPTDWTY